MPINVLVWEYHSVRHCGHAALRISHGGREAYCSWWPSDIKTKNAGKGKGSDFPSPVKRGVLDRTFPIDAKAECGADGRLRFSAFENGTGRLRPGQQLMGENQDGTAEIWQHPQHDIAIPGIQDGPAVAGLDLERMLTCWNLLNINPRRKYRLVSKEYNCSSIAAAILVVGGAAFYSEVATGRKPDLGFMWTNPNHVRDWAMQIRDGIAMARRAQGMVLQPTFAGDGGPMLAPANGHNEIMDLATWKRISAVKMSFATGLARRGEQVAKIDEYLRDYHILGPWNWRNFAQCKQKIGRLGAMLREACSHIMEKANSNRRDAVLQLATQVIARYNHVSELYERFLRPQILEIIEREVHTPKLV